MTSTNRALAVGAAALFCLSGLSALLGVGAPTLRRRVPADAMVRPSPLPSVAERDQVRRQYEEFEQRQYLEMRPLMERSRLLREQRQPRRQTPGTQNRLGPMEPTLPRTLPPPPGKQRP